MIGRGYTILKPVWNEEGDRLGVSFFFAWQRCRPKYFFKKPHLSEDGAAAGCGKLADGIEQLLARIGAGVEARRQADAARRRRRDAGCQRRRRRRRRRRGGGVAVGAAALDGRQEQRRRRRHRLGPHLDVTRHLLAVGLVWFFFFCGGGLLLLIWLSFHPIPPALSRNPSIV